VVALLIKASTPPARASTPPQEERVTFFFTRVKKKVTKKESTLSAPPRSCFAILNRREGCDPIDRRQKVICRQATPALEATFVQTSAEHADSQQQR
jgi:hypothetical protein